MREKATEGLNLLKEAVIEFLKSRPSGATHAEICTELALESDYEGGSLNYLSYSVLGLLLKDGRVSYRTVGKKKHYFAK